jgi:hypothetical protein
MKMPMRYTAHNDFIGQEWPRSGFDYGTFQITAPARPIGGGPFWQRWRLAWAVFTGRADALFWLRQ